MSKRKRIGFGLAALALMALTLIVICDRRIRDAAAGKTFDAVEQLPHNHVGLLLGTSKYLKRGRINPYYRYRIEAAVRLLRAGKVDYLVLSGDNRRKEYNEPETMRADLIAAGIDSSRLFLDYAGFRTFDSIVRLREIFSQRRVTLVSQRFHNERALYIASREGIDAVGYNASDVGPASGLKTRLREHLARVKVFIDYLFGASPKFYGDKVPIPD